MNAFSNHDLEQTRQVEKPRGNRMTSWQSLELDIDGVGYLNGIWNDIPNVSFYRDEECQENTTLENSASLLSNKASSDTSPDKENSLFYELVSLENQILDLSNSEEPSFGLCPHTCESDSLQISSKLNIPWNTFQFPSMNQEEQENLNNTYPPIEELSWSQIASRNYKEGFYSTHTLCETDNSTNERPTTALNVKYLSDSKFTPSLSGVPAFSLMQPTRPYTVLKIQNMPWYSSTNEISNILKAAFIIPSDETLPLNVHFMMDRHSGKTTGLAFAEVIPKSQDSNKLRAVLKSLEKSPFQGRRLKISLSNYDQLREKLFYDWSGQFKNGLAISSTNADHHTTIGNSGLFVCQKDLQSIQNICKNFKSCYNRQCPERAFEYLMSIVINIPWLQKNIVLTWQRDLLYESFKLVTDTLRLHISRPLHTIDDGLLLRFVRSFIICEGFTVKQKFNILKTSKMECPKDLLHYITEVPEDPLSIID